MLLSLVQSELENKSSLKEEQRTTLKAFLHGTNVKCLLQADLGKSVIYQLAVLVIRFVDLIGQSQSVTDGDRGWFIQSPVWYLFKVLALFQMVSNGAFPDGCV